MKPDKRNNNDGGNNKRNALGLVSIILWALFLTLLFRSCWSSYENAGMVEVPYTTFKEWLEADKIQQANVESGQITFTLREGGRGGAAPAGGDRRCGRPDERTASGTAPG